MTDSKIELADYLPYLLNRVAAALVERHEVELKRHDLTIAMWRVLVSLLSRGRQRQIDLADMTAIDVSTLSRLISRMIGMDLVSRSRSDNNNREVAVELTSKGRALVIQLVPLGQALEGIAIEGLSPSELATVRDALRRMYDNLRRNSGSDTPASRTHLLRQRA